MTTDALEVARRRRAALQQNAPTTRVVPEEGCEISEKSEKSRAADGLISHNSLISQSVPVQREMDDPLVRARTRIRELRVDMPDVEPQTDDRDPSHGELVTRMFGSPSTTTDCEISEKSEKSEKRSANAPASALLADPFRAWRLRNAELLMEADGQLGHDYGGYCAKHRRALSYPEQKRGACSWCVAVNPETEPAYWESHWRRFRRRDESANAAASRQE